MACESENPRGVPFERVEPGNQQERLTVDWIVGFTDGEGCFSIGVVRQPDRPNRRGYRTGYQVSHDFSVTQGARSRACLDGMRNFSGVGHVYPNSRHDNHREHLYQFSVAKRSELLNVIIPFFRRHALRTSKREDFVKFARCLELMKMDRHRTREGQIEILEIAQTMNRRVPRDDLIRILRGHTPDIRESE